MSKLQINSIAHITGGGLTENIPRVIPKELQAILDLESWRRPAIFSWIQDQGNIDNEEMYRTFNCGLGMVICVDPNNVDSALRILNQDQINASVIGHVSERPTDQQPIRFV